MEFVSYIETRKGKKLLKVFKSKRAVDMFLKKNTDKILSKSGIESVGSMSKRDWDSKEAKYAVNEAKYKVGDTITVIRKDGMKYKGKVEKLNPLKLRTDSTSTVVLPNPMIKKVVKESVNEGKKRYYQQDRVGSAKYTISYHDGKKKHKDGSDFFDIQTFKNKKDLAKFVNTLHKGGFVYGFNESSKYRHLYYTNESKTKESKVIQKIYTYTKTEKKFYDELAKHEVRIGQKDYAKFIIMALKGFGINPREFKRIPDAEEKLYQTVSKKWLNSKNYLTKS